MDTKSRAALFHSCLKLVSGAEFVAFWTFTYPDVIAVEEATARWQAFTRALSRRFKRKGGLKALRVYEMHPGGHGLHVHVLTTNYLRVQELRKLWTQFGGGRIHVEPCYDLSCPEKLAGYMSKYLSKSTTGQSRGGSGVYDGKANDGQGKMKRCGALRAKRLWGAMGKWDYTRRGQIDVQSKFNSFHQQLRVACTRKSAELAGFFAGIDPETRPDVLFPDIEAAMDNLADLAAHKKRIPEPDYATVLACEAEGVDPNPELTDTNRAIKSACWAYLLAVRKIYETLDARLNAELAFVSGIINQHYKEYE